MQTIQFWVDNPSLSCNTSRVCCPRVGGATAETTGVRDILMGFATKDTALAVDENLDLQTTAAHLRMIEYLGQIVDRPDRNTDGLEQLNPLVHGT